MIKTLGDARVVFGFLNRLGMSLSDPVEVRGAKAYDPRDAWSISPFPDGRAFGFTIVHDADQAYSRRLAPLFAVFDECGLKITVTAFVFWAAWADGRAAWRQWRQTEAGGDSFFVPECVPLEDDEERKFYLELSLRGHELGMHTPSDTSSNREDVVRAFHFFKAHFGRYPSIYVEHRAWTNLDAQAREGSIPGSIYYNRDLLNSYGPWVWLDDPCGVPHRLHPKFYDILAVNGSPFHNSAAQQYGIRKAFLRTGKWKEGDGDGFLNHYSEQRIDALEKHRGLAIVYTHLDKKWLDANTRKMRAAITDRLKYLASKNGWFVPAGTILDRVQAIHRLKLYHDKRVLKVVNGGSENVEGLTIVSNKRRSLRRGAGVLRPATHGDIIIGPIRAGETLSFEIV